MYGIDVIKNDVPTSNHNSFIIKNAFTTIFNGKKQMKLDSCEKLRVLLWWFFDKLGFMIEHFLFCASAEMWSHDYKVKEFKFQL